MGYSTDLYIYDRNTLFAAFTRDGIPASEHGRLQEILAKFGLFAGDYYILLNNERSEDGNPYFSMAEVLDAVFTYTGQNENFWDTYFHAPKVIGITYADPRDVAEELGIDLAPAQEERE